MDRSAALLARAWYRAWRGWWWVSGLALACVLVLVLATAGLLDGMEAQTEERVADFYTGALRVTVEDQGAAPAAVFPFATQGDLDQARHQLEDAAGGGARVEARMETTYALSRRSLVEAYLFEDEQYGIALPGVASDRDAYSVGVLTGLDLGVAATRERLRPYLVTGSFPTPAANDSAPVQMLMSVAQFRSMLTPQERERLGDVPSAGQLSALSMELTAARVDDSGPYKDIIRLPARVTGVYDSGIDALDRITVVAPVQDVRRLMGHAPDDPVANVLTLHADGRGAAGDLAERNGWKTEGADSFTQRYLGQLVAVVRVLGLTLSSLLMVFPVFMVWVGLSQQLDRNQRELAVCRAIGFGPASVRRALLRLTLRVAAIALVPAASLLVLATLVLPSVLASGSVPFPFPLGFSIPPWALVVTAVLVLGSGTFALAGALRRYRRADLAGTLRSL